MISGRAEPESFDSEALLRALFDDGPDAVLCTDSRGVIVKANSRAAELFGYRHDELVGVRVEVLIPERLRPRHERLRERFTVESRRRPLGAGLNIIARRKDGSEFAAAVNLSPQASRSGDFVAAVIADISDLRQAEEQLRKSEERYRELIEHSPDACYLTNVDSRIAFVNPMGLTLLKAGSASQIVDKPLSDFVHPEDWRTITALLQRLERSPAQARTAEVRLVLQDGTEVDVEALVGSARYQDMPALQFVIRDIGERKRAEALQVRALAAEESDRLKTQLLGTVSHELRTPLTAVRGYASTILEYSDRLDRAEVLQHVAGIEEAAQHLERMVSDLLTLSRIQSGAFSVELKEMHLCTFLEGAIANLVSASPTLDIRLNRRGVDPLVRADDGRLLQVVTNLVDNAAVHGDPAKAIAITVGTTAGSAVVTILDRGPGVPEHLLDAIFLPYFRVTDSANASSKGSGLGLAICQGIISAHGGRVWANQTKTGGFEVSFALPLAR